MPEYKAIPQFTKAIEDRTVTGIFAVHGNIDEGMDRSWPGSFTNIAVNGRTRARFVWQHRTDEPPTAMIKSIREVGRNDLPPAVLSYAPETTGGVEVTREYLDTPRGSEVLAGIKAGAIDEMSYAYDVTRFDFEEVDGRGMVRNIREVKLYDVSDVLWGMNPATTAAKSMEIEYQTALAAVSAFIKRLEAIAALRAKEGRVLSDANMRRIQEAMDAMHSAMDALGALMQMAEPQKTGRAELNQLRAAWTAQQQRLRELGVPLL